MEDTAGKSIIQRRCRVYCVKYSSDATYVISGSDDTNIRLWKAKASEQLGVILPREQKKHEYNEAVKNRYKHLPEVKRIVRHRHLPKPIYIAKGNIRTVNDSKRRKEDEGKLTVLQEQLSQNLCAKEGSSKLNSLYRNNLKDIRCLTW